MREHIKRPGPARTVAAATNPIAALASMGLERADGLSPMSDTAPFAPLDPNAIVGPAGRRDRVRGEPRAALQGAQTAEAIVPVIQPDDRYPGRRPPGGYKRHGLEMSTKQSRIPSTPDVESNRVARVSAVNARSRGRARAAPPMAAADTHLLPRLHASHSGRPEYHGTSCRRESTFRSVLTRRLVLRSCS